MAPPFTPLDLRGFVNLLDAWVKKPGHREVTEVHMHHTWRPNHAQYRGQASIEGMWRYHTDTNGWSDIAQHVTIAPDGTIWTGRHWDQPPASSAGRNGSRQRGPFMFEMIGDFDTGRDVFGGQQQNAVLSVIALVQDAFNLPVESLYFHRGLGSPKTCPGSAIRYEDVVAAVRRLRNGGARPRGAARGAETPELGTARARILEEPPMAAEDPDAEPPEEHGHTHGEAGSAARDEDPIGPAVLARLRPHLVNLWGGRYSRQGRFRTDATDVAAIFSEYLPARVRALPEGKALPILLYAHGGLVSEEDGLRMAAAQIPWWLGNGVFPLHFIWETGLGETIARMIGVQRAVAAPLPSRGAAPRGILDPAIEVLVRGAGGPHVWGGMKFGASAAFDTGGDGLDLLRQMAAFVKAHEGRVTLHALGHSAGSIFHAYLLPRLIGELRQAGSAARIEALHLMAPAITVADYKARLDPHIGGDIRSLAMFTMAKDYELADTVTPLYRKSLLYLISRALEPERDTAVLGLEESVRADDALRRRFGLGGTPGDAAEVIWSRTAATSGMSASLSVTHGGFDNDPATMESILRRVRGLRDTESLDLRFPAEAATGRSFADIAAQAVSDSQTGPVPLGADLAPLDAPIPPALSDRTRSGRRRALCVGVDAYPDPAARLSGCVADARDWEEGLTRLGFSVQHLHDSAATRRAIVDNLGRMLREAQPGDQLVFTYSGHGMQLDDVDADEDDAKDEAICPFDYDDGRLVIDDDFAAIFRRLDEGVQLTCFFDCCHSGTNTRFAVGRAELPADARARFLRPTPELMARHRSFRRGLGPEVGGARGRGRSTPAQMRQVVFAACQPWEVALEMNGRGDFSVRAVPLLAHAGQVTNARFQQLVTARFGATPRQNPNLDCAPAARNAPFLAGARPGSGREEQPERLDGGPDGNLPLPEGASDARMAAAADLLNAAARLLR